MFRGRRTLTTEQASVLRAIDQSYMSQDLLGQSRLGCSSYSTYCRQSLCLSILLKSERFSQFIIWQSQLQPELYAAIASPEG